MPFSIVRNDITKMNTDAIVNAANTSLKKGGGVCGAIFSAAGAERLQKECDSIGNCGVGKSVITGGYDLPAKYIIHTLGTVLHGGNTNYGEFLYNAYWNSLVLAKEYSLESIAFPLISSGIYGYPKEEAIRIAVRAIGDFLMEQDMMVYLVVYDRESFAIGEKNFSAIERYIDDNYVDEHPLERNQAYSFYHTVSKRSLEDVLSSIDESFPEMLIRLIDEKGFTDVETYKKANIDRRLFSKIRSNGGYNPSKATAIAFAVALELNLDETLDLLSKAGYTLSHSSKFDLIIEYYIENRKYNIFEINEALFAFDQPLLGG